MPFENLQNMPTTEEAIAVAAPKDLRRELGLASATAVVAGECIAVGIFLTPAGMAKALGSPMWLLLVWLGVGAMTLSGALSYGELAGRFPQAGGGYVYLKEAFGRRTAFLYGWMCLLVMDPGLTASLATGSAAYAAYIFHWNPVATKLAAIAGIWVLCLVNILSIRLSAGFMRWITVAETGRARADHSVGDFVPLGFVVEFHSVPGAAARFHAFGRRPRGCDGGSFLFIWRVVGSHQDCRRSARSGSHHATGAGSGRSAGDNDLCSYQRYFSLPATAAECHL